MFGACSLDSAAFAESAIRRAIEAAGATMLNIYVHKFESAGVAAVATLAESHIALHTWPEHDLVTVDAFTCGDADPQRAIDELLRVYAPERHEVRSIARAVDRRDFVEHEPGSPIHSVYSESKWIYDGHSEHQRISVFERAGIGRVLALEDIVQVTELDAFVYHEMLAHPTWEPDPRVRVEHRDAFGALEPDTYDVVLADIPDPLGPAERLFGAEFFAQARASLRNTGGVLAVQCESLHFHPEIVRRCVSALRRDFSHVGVVQGAIATYPGAWWMFAVASTLDSHPSVARGGHDVRGTRMYRRDAHAWYFIPDAVLEGLLGSR